MAGFTNFLAGGLLGQAFGGSDFAESGNHYIALSSGTTPQDDGSGFSEITDGTGYARVEVANTSAEWLAPPTGDGPVTTHNRNIVSFNQSSGTWGTVNFFGVFDTLTGGNFLGFGAIGPESVGDNNTLSFASGNLVITVN